METEKRRSTTSPTIPGDVLEEIFSWIPSKDLLSLRLVSKAWRSCINETLNPLPFMVFRRYIPRLKSKYGCRHGVAIKQPRLKKRVKNKLAYTFILLEPNFSFLPTPVSDYERIITSFCNGLYMYIDIGGRPKTCKCIVYDTGTRNSTILPHPPNIHWNPLTSFVTLVAFEPRESLNYKILAWYRCRGNSPTLYLAIYSSEYKSWGHPKPFQHVEFYWSVLAKPWAIPVSAFVNGAMYVYNIDNVIRIDLSSETCRIIALPECVGAEREEGLFHMGLQSGRLCCAQLDGLQLTVWKLEDDERWVVKHYNNHSMVTEFPCKDGPRIVAFNPCSDVVLIRREGILSLYDTRNSMMGNACSLFRMVVEGWAGIVVEPSYHYPSKDGKEEHAEKLEASHS